MLQFEIRAGRKDVQVVAAGHDMRCPSANGLVVDPDEITLSEALLGR